MGGSVDENASESDKPVHMTFPDPSDDDFDEDIEEEERKHYKAKFKDLNDIKNFKPHCTACDRHLGCSTRNDTKMRVHPMLRTLVCSTCHSFYNSGEFDKGEDGSELYCRWCGQGGQVYCCSDCPVVFCAKCIRRNLGNPKIKEIENLDDWKCFKCNPRPLWPLRAVCWALLRYVDLKIKITHKTTDPELKERYDKDCLVDHSDCCKDKKKRTSIGRKKEETKKPEVKIEGSKKPDTKIEAPVKLPPTIPVKLPPTIQVKKFAAINVDEPKKAQKRPASPKNKLNYVSKPISIAPRMSVNPMYTSFAKRPKMDEVPLASTSTDSGLPVVNGMEGFSHQKGKDLSELEKSRIINVFKMFYQKSLKESEERMPDEAIQFNRQDIRRACVKTVAKHLNVRNCFIDQILKESGIFKRTYHTPGPVDHLITKLIPNPYQKERMPFMPMVHAQYMPRKPPPPPMSSSPYPPLMVSRPMQSFNGYPVMTADNINLSLESLTQGLDVNAMLAHTGRNARAPIEDSQLVCTPDFPLEPMCEVVEENNDDDVECMTPGPVAPPKHSHTASGSKRSNRGIDTDNIIQMTENDVTVNASTGGLKFRVDPQTLSANKMYRLPDGRVFAINANPKMPGGYSATIVALTEEGNKHLPTKGTTYSAKVSSIAKPSQPQEKRPVSVIKKANALQDKVARTGNSVNNGQNKSRKCDLSVPVEWYIYNVTDAIDSLEYTLTRLKKLKKNTNSTFLRTRTVEEVHTLHKNLDRLLSNSSTRFSEIRSSLCKGFKNYCQRKAIGNTFSDWDTDNNEDDDDDDDDVEILADNHDEPIFIDENSIDSNSATADRRVDLISSDFNESGDKEKSTTKSNKIKNRTDLNEKSNDSQDPITTSNLSNEIEQTEKGDKGGNETSGENTTQNDETPSEPSQQKDLAESMETNDDTDGNLEPYNASGDEADIHAVENNDEAYDEMVTSVIAKEDDEEEKKDSGNCDTRNAENNCEGSDAEKHENDTDENRKDGEDIQEIDDDKETSEIDKELKDDKDIGDKGDNDKNIENDLLDDSQDIEKLDDDDIESLLKGSDGFDDLASKVQCIVDMDPDLI